MTDTSGPWHIDSSGFLVTADGLLVQNAKAQYSKADANKIAAAPEMLAFLEGMRDDCGHPCVCEYLGRMEALIAKAKGETV